VRLGVKDQIYKCLICKAKANDIMAMNLEAKATNAAYNTKIKIKD